MHVFAEDTRGLLQVGKGYAAQAAKAKNKAEAYAVQEAGFTSLQSVFAKGVPALDNLKVVAQQLRRLPTVDVEVPTVSSGPQQCDKYQLIVVKS